MRPLRRPSSRPLPVGLSAVATLATGVLVAWLPLAAPAATLSASAPVPAPAATASPQPDVPAAGRAPVRSAAPLPADRRAAAVRPAAGHDRTSTSFLAAQQDGGLTCTASALGPDLCSHGEDAPPVADQDGHDDPAGGWVAAEGGDVPLPCYGDGQSGPRVRAVYARPEGSADRYAEHLPSFRHWASVVDRRVDASAMRTGQRRHVRFTTTAGPDCVLSVRRVVLPPSAFLTFNATVDALQRAGFGRDGAKNLVWADAAGYCGIASTFVDDSPGLSNANNTGAGYARIDRRCWGKVETHELVHMLGGVQPSAPHSTAGLHCSDGEDPMCYDDGTARSTQRSVCADHATVLDCGKDDYFSTSAPRGSYLQTHWNVARSSYLSALTSESAPPAGSTPPPASSPAPSPTSAAQVPALPALPPLPPLPLLPALLGGPR